MRHNLLYVLVIYKQPIYETNTYNSLLADNCNCSVFVYDNSPIAQHDAAEFKGSSIHYVSNTNNPGLSYAYNRAAEYAKEHGFVWMMLLDQDTLFSNETISEFEVACAENPMVKLFVPPVKVSDVLYMSPVRMRNYNIKMAREVPVGIIDSRRYAPINSGMIVNIEALLDVGGYNERVALDHSDYQFMMRFRRKYSEFYVLATPCYQEFSNLVQSSEQKLGRFVVFCCCLKNCEKPRISDKFSYLYIVIKRSLSLCLSTCSLKPLSILLYNYFK